MVVAGLAEAGPGVSDPGYRLQFKGKVEVYTNVPIAFGLFGLLGR